MSVLYWEFPDSCIIFIRECSERKSIHSAVTRRYLSTSTYFIFFVIIVTHFRFQIKILNIENISTDRNQSPDHWEGLIRARFVPGTCKKVRLVKEVCYYTGG